MGVGLLRAEGHESWEKGMTFVKGHGICESQRTLGFTYSVLNNNHIWTFKVQDMAF